VLFRHSVSDAVVAEQILSKEVLGGSGECSKSAPLAPPAPDLTRFSAGFGLPVSCPWGQYLWGDLWTAANGYPQDTFSDWPFSEALDYCVLVQSEFLGIPADGGSNPSRCSKRNSNASLTGILTENESWLPPPPPQRTRFSAGLDLRV
jgi:hypothetical protein